MGRYAGELSKWPKCSHRVLIRESLSVKIRRMLVVEAGVMCFEDPEKGAMSPEMRQALGGGGEGE